MDKLKEVSPQLAELIEEILSDDEGLKGFLPNQPVQTGEKVLARISHEKIEKGCLFWHKHFDEKNLRQRTETAL